MESIQDLMATQQSTALSTPLRPTYNPYSPLGMKLSTTNPRVRDMAVDELLEGLYGVMTRTYLIKGQSIDTRQEEAQAIVTALSRWLNADPCRAGLTLSEVEYAISDGMSKEESYGVTFQNISRSVTSYIQGQGAEAFVKARAIQEGRYSPDGSIPPDRWALMQRIRAQYKKDEERYYSHIDLEAVKKRLRLARYYDSNKRELRAMFDLQFGVDDMPE